MPATLRCFTCDSGGTCCAHFRFVLFRLGAIRARRKRPFTPPEKFYRVAPSPPRVASSHFSAGVAARPFARSRECLRSLSFSLSLSVSSLETRDSHETPESGSRPRGVPEIFVSRLVAVKGRGDAGDGACNGRNKVHARFCVRWVALAAPPPRVSPL